MWDLGESSDHTEVKQRLTEKLIENLYGSDLAWVEGDRLVGLADKKYEPKPNRGMQGQRGWRFM